MTDPLNETVLRDIKRDASVTLDSLKTTLEGLLLEIRGGQRRSFDNSDFLIDEFRRLTRSIDALVTQLERLR